jgi:hypothetical protein
MMTIDDERPVPCLTPIDAVVLSDYWLAALPPAEEEALETHLLSCDSCSARLRDVIALAEGVRALAREGRVRLVVSDAFVRRLAEDGVPVREYAPPAGGSVNCTVTAEDTLLVARLATDLIEAQRVDLCICDEHGLERLRLPDIPVRAGTSSVIFHEDTAFMKAAPTFTMVVRLVAVDDAGERLLGAYTFNHTRTLPGQGAW